MPDALPEIPGGPQLRTVAMPRDANPGGHIFGGWTLGQMDLAGASLAAEHSEGRVATVAIEAMRFLHPVEGGDEVSCFCTLERAATPPSRCGSRPGRAAAARAGGRNR
jgi:acyl-CoA thioesterase YciA